MATGALRTIERRSPSSVSTRAAWPDTSPPPGMATTLVMPAWWAGAHKVDEGFSPSHERNAAAT